MTITLVGDGPGAEAVAAAVADADAEMRTGDATEVGGTDLAVVVAPAGDERFVTANEAVGDATWLAVETGGVGGRTVDGVEAAVTGFGPETGCYECLRSRVAASAPDAEAGGSTVDAATRRFAGAVAGRELAALLSGDERVLGSVVEVPHARRTLLRVPTCACAPEREYVLGRDHRSVPLETAIERAERALDERVGPLETVGELYSYPAPYYMAQTADTTGFSDARAAPKAGGCAAEWDGAFVKALGEGLERYCAGIYRTDEFQRAPVAGVADARSADQSPGEDGPLAVPPGAFVTPDEAGSVPTDEPIHWVPGADLRSGESVSLPAEVVHYPPPSRRFARPITTGLALGSSTVEALLSGLYETVERDATMLAWYSTFEPMGLAVEDEAYEQLERRARSEGLSTTALLVTQDVDVPVVAAAVHREGEWPRFAVGSGADLDPAAAARSALAEAIQNWMELRGMGEEAAAAESGAIGRYASFPSAAEAFVDPDATVPAASVGPDAVPEGSDELDAVVALLADAGLDAYAARLTTPDVESIGFEAVRTLVPAAQPLFTDRPYFGERARRVPEALGFDPALDREHHPYP